MTDSGFEAQFIQARREFIEGDFSHLNPMQRQAVMATEGPLLLLAGAGSGKTTVLINRIANLIRYGRGPDSLEVNPAYGHGELAALKEAAGNPEHPQYKKARQMAAVDPVPPWQIMAITFTNKAANELKFRLEKMLGESARDVWAMTFHAACVRILRKNIEETGFQRGFTIYDTADSQSVMKRVLRELDLDEKTFPYRSVLASISRAKDAMLTPQAFLEEMRKTGDIRKIKTAQAYESYAARLKEANAMDFDDLMFFAVKLLDENKALREYYQRRFRYLLIDEYQDTNQLQYTFASLIAGGYKNICVVGDDDQSIYKFRGATIENILNFEKQYSGARTIKLEQNYRSTSHILDAANAVIRNNQGRKGKELWTGRSPGEKITLYQAQDERDEAQYVASRIVDGIQQGDSWGDYALLYRINALSNQFEFAFKRAGIPYKIIGGTRFFDRAEIKDMLAYLCLIQSESDDLRLRRVINVPARGIGAKTLEEVAALAQSQGVHMFDIVRNAGEIPRLQRCATRLRSFANMILELREFAETQPSDALYDLLLEKTGYLRMLEAKETDENISRAENVRELKSSIIGYINETGDPSLSGFLDEVALYTDLDQVDKEGDSVLMMTMHSAKGLEFPHVFLVGMEEGLFPSVRSFGFPEEMEEERRLCYVALTRAMDRLTISCAGQRMLFGRTTTNLVSRFADEIPDEYVSGSVPRRPARGRQDRLVKGQKGGPEDHSKARSFAPLQNRETPGFALNDRVSHRAFGKGVIVKLTPMGGDFLTEIEFEKVGKKRVMLRAAAQYMTKE